jgi:hypothetical protein
MTYFYDEIKDVKGGRAELNKTDAGRDSFLAIVQSAEEYISKKQLDKVTKELDNVTSQNGNLQLELNIITAEKNQFKEKQSLTLLI